MTLDQVQRAEKILLEALERLLNGCTVNELLKEE